MFKIDFYDTEDGKCPVQEFLDSLEPKIQAKTLKNLDLLEANGNMLGEPFSGPMGDGIFELRTKQSTNITRVFYFFFVGKRIIITNGIVKKTQKTPRNALALARKYKADYERRFCK